MYIAEMQIRNYKKFISLDLLFKMEFYKFYKNHPHKEIMGWNLTNSTP